MKALVYLGPEAYDVFGNAAQHNALKVLIH